jgi:outer membrane lipoprotein SlyB
MTAASRLGRTPRPGPSIGHDAGAAFDQQQLQYQTQRFVEVQDPNTDPALVAHERARLAEIQKVHAHAREVAALQADFAALVASQDDGIAQAEAQTATAADHISHGRKQLAKAIKAGAFAATIAGAAVGAVLGGPIVGMALLGAQSALTVGAATAAGGVVGVAAASAVNTRTKQSVKGAELTCNEADAAAT